MSSWTNVNRISTHADISLALSHYSRAIGDRKVDDIIDSLATNFIQQTMDATRFAIIDCVVKGDHTLIRNQRAEQIPIQLYAFVVVIRVNMKIVDPDVVGDEVFTIGGFR